jgi:hypothetical protein
MNVIHSLLPATVRLPGSDHQLFSVWLPFGFLGLIAWSVWLGRRLLTALYRPVDNDHHEPVAVVSPCFREDPEILEHAVHSWLAAGAQDVVLVFPLDEQENLFRADAAFSGEHGVRFVQTSNPEKRCSLAAGILSAIHPSTTARSSTSHKPGPTNHDGARATSCISG